MPHICRKLWLLAMPQRLNRLSSTWSNASAK
jgi:hypothetical protein